MIEKIKAVNNPLTIIAIFAALAEIAGTVALKLVSQDLQETFIWFVMLFPVLLVILFFITLNFNPKVLYAPSDFKDEENFLTAIYGVNRLSNDLKDVQKQLEVAKTEIIDDALKQVGVASENERSRLEQIVNSRIKVVEERVESTRESAEGIANEYTRIHLPSSVERVLSVLGNGEALTVDEIAMRAGLKTSTVRTILVKYRDKIQVEKSSGSLPGGNRNFYRLVNPISDA